MKLIKPNIMKYLLLFCFGLSIILNCHTVFGQNATDNPENAPGGVKGNTINIVTSPELNNLTADWIRDYEKIECRV